jgi:hypothetical protein
MVKVVRQTSITELYPGNLDQSSIGGIPTCRLGVAATSVTTGDTSDANGLRFSQNGLEEPNGISRGNEIDQNGKKIAKIAVSPVVIVIVPALSRNDNSLGRSELHHFSVETPV